MLMVPMYSFSASWAKADAQHSVIARHSRIVNALQRLLFPAIPIFYKHWPNFVNIRDGTEMRTDFIWNKEGELKRIGQWNEKTIEQLNNRN